MNLFHKLFRACKSQRREPTPPRIRPTPEALEPRLVPSSFYWWGTNPNNKAWTNIPNWSTTPAFYTAATSLPGSGDDVYFSKSYSTEDCEVNAQVSINSIHIDTTYGGVLTDDGGSIFLANGGEIDNGTIELHDDFNLDVMGGTFVMNGGAIGFYQNAQGTFRPGHLYVFSGATLIINPGGNPTASTLAAHLINNGTVELDGSLGFWYVTDPANIMGDPAIGNHGTFIINVAGSETEGPILDNMNTFVNFGTLESNVGPGQSYTFDMALYDEHGTVEVQSGALDFKAATALAKNYSVYITGDGTQLLLDDGTSLGVWVGSTGKSVFVDVGSYFTCTGVSGSTQWSVVGAGPAGSPIGDFVLDGTLTVGGLATTSGDVWGTLVLTGLYLDDYGETQLGYHWDGTTFSACQVQATSADANGVSVYIRTGAMMGVAPTYDPTPPLNTIWVWFSTPAGTINDAVDPAPTGWKSLGVIAGNEYEIQFTH